jgi:hypothetical protein
MGLFGDAAKDKSRSFEQAIASMVNKGVNAFTPQSPAMALAEPPVSYYDTPVNPAPPVDPWAKAVSDAINDSDGSDPSGYGDSGDPADVGGTGDIGTGGEPGVGEGTDPDADGPGYAAGGWVGSGLFGKDPPGPDDGAGYLDQGEFVIRKSAAQSLEKKFPGLLEKLNRYS